jgi:zinc protease
MVAKLTAPGYRDEAMRQFHKQLPALESQLKHSLAGASSEMSEWLYSGDGRFAKVDPDELATYTTDDVRAWVESDMAQAYLELTLVGDLEIEFAIPLILKTFGALPERADESEALPSASEVTHPEFPAEKSFTYDSKIDKAVALVHWLTDPIGDNASEARRMNILASIVSDRLRKEIREELGSSYSPGAGYSASFVFETASFTTSSVATSKTVDELQKAMQRICAEIVNEGIDEDEFQRALKPAMTELELSLRQNSHWLNTIMGKSQEKPITLDWARNREADYASITVEELEALAQRYLMPGKAGILSLLPVLPEE